MGGVRRSIRTGPKIDAVNNNANTTLSNERSIKRCPSLLTVSNATSAAVRCESPDAIPGAHKRPLPVRTSISMVSHPRHRKSRQMSPPRDQEESGRLFRGHIIWWPIAILRFPTRARPFNWSSGCQPSPVRVASVTHLPSMETSLAA